MKEVAPESLLKPGITICSLQDHQILDLSQLQCPLCSDFLNSPVELVTYGSVVCAQYFNKCLKRCKQLTCPCCSSSRIADFRSASHLTQSMLGRLCVVCDKYQSHLRLDKLKEHASSSSATQLSSVLTTS